jgi:hypothetical protein
MNMDPSTVWSWVNKHKKEKNMQIVPIDIKLSVNHRSAHQDAPIFIVAPPENTGILCILPADSYTSLFANWKLEKTDDHGTIELGSNKVHRMRPREPLHVSSLLAPFAVQQRHLYEALLRLEDLFISRSPYVNPSNSVSLRGWTPPKPESSLEKLMMVSGTRQRQSAEVIQSFVEVLNAWPDCQMELLFNLVQPLGCDLILRDKASSIAYLIEHKVTTAKQGKYGVTLKPVPAWMDFKHNWHFLLHQQDHWLVIHTREGHKNEDTTPAIRIDLKSNKAASVIASTIRSHGPLAKERLQTKWRALDVYEDSLPGEERNSTENNKTGQKISTLEQSVYTFKGAKERFRIHFCEAMNDYCYKLGRHAIIILEGHACGDAAMIRYEWTEYDKARYAMSRTLPVSLVDGEQRKSLDVLVLRFLPHSWPPRVSRSEMFEPTRTRTIEIPVCMGQPFIYVAATGSSPSPNRQPHIDKLILLPSEYTDWLGETPGCSICDDDTRMREWKPIIQTVGEGQGAGQPGSSIVQAPFLNKAAEPLCQVYDFEDGSVHAHLEKLLSKKGSNYVTSLHGPKGLLQRQWNHGGPRQMMNRGASGSSPIQK